MFRGILPLTVEAPFSYIKVTHVRLQRGEINTNFKQTCAADWIWDIGNHRVLEVNLTLLTMQVHSLAVLWEPVLLGQHFHGVGGILLYQAVLSPVAPRIAWSTQVSNTCREWRRELPPYSSYSLCVYRDHMGSSWKPIMQASPKSAPQRDGWVCH